MFDFQKLEVYKKAKILHKDCKVLIAENKFGKTVNDQLYRASFSLPLNIAEGSGRFTKPDRRNFFVIARGSAFECSAVFDILNDDNLIESSRFIDLMTKADELSRILYAMIKNLGD